LVKDSIARLRVKPASMAHGERATWHRGQAIRGFYLASYDEGMNTTFMSCSVPVVESKRASPGRFLDS
jgi:hypothetical protein